MSEELLIRCCAPTLAGIKTGSMFSCRCQCRKKLLKELRRLNRLFVPKGLCLLPLRFTEGRALLYLFRRDGLERDLSHDEAARLLEDAGYSRVKAVPCIKELIRRLNEQESFPHEVGLFLSYPPEDVRGFIENNAKCFKCVGCWKVYGDEQAAKRRFDRYEKCTRLYRRQWLRGKTVDQLTVKAR